MAVRNAANIFIYRNIVPTSFNGTSNVTVAGTSIPPFTTGSSGVGYYNITSNPITVTATTSQIALYYRANTFSYLLTTNNTHQFFLYLINVDTATGTITTAKATFSTNALNANSVPRFAAVASLGSGNAALFVAGNALDLLYRFSETLFDGTSTITLNGVSIPHSSGYAVPVTTALIRFPHGSTVGQSRAAAIAFNPTTSRTLLFSGSGFNYELPLANFDGTTERTLKGITVLPVNSQYSLVSNLSSFAIPSFASDTKMDLDLVDPSRSVLSALQGTFYLASLNRHTTSLTLPTQRFTSAPAITKSSPTAPLILSTLIDAYQALYILSAGSQFLSLQGSGANPNYSNGEYYPFAFTQTDDAAGTLNENFTLSGSSASITGIYRLTMASGTTLTLSGKATYSESFTLLSGSTLAIAQNTTLTGDLVLNSGTTVTRAADATGNYTLTLPYSSGGITAGTGITIAAPQASLAAPNFANDTRVYAARVQSFTIASTAINTSTDTITLGNDAQGNAAAFATAPPYTQVRFSLNSGATLPTTTGSVLKDGGFYYWSGGKLYTSTANIPGTPIDFTSQGSGNFTLLAETELFNITISGNSGLSQTLNLNTGTLIRLKAAYWVKSNGIATAGAFFDNRDSLISWSATGGVAIGATVGPTNLEAVHEAIVNTAQIQSNKYGLLSPADSGDTLSQFSIALEGIGTLQINSIDLDGVELIQNIFLWWCWIRSTPEGMRLASYDTLQAINFTSYQAGRVEVENTNASLPLNIAGGSITFPGSSTGIAANSYAINLNADVFGTGATVTTGGISPSATDIRNALGVNAPNLDTQLGNINSKTTNLPASFPVVDGSGRVTVGSLADGAITAAKIADNAITAAKIATDAIDADAIAASAVTEIQTGLATPGNVPTPAQIAAQVRTELAIELARLDLAVSTRLAAANYTTPPTTAQIATAIEAALLNDADGQALLAAIQTAVQALFDQQADIPVATLVSLIAARITADHGSGSYTTANLSALALEASVQAIKAKTDNLPSDPADQSELVTLINTKASQASVDAIPTTPLLAANYTAPDNAGIAAIKAKTDNLPSDPADQSELATLISAIPTTPLLAANYTAPDNAGIAAIKAKTDNLPSDPADQSELVTLINTKASQTSVDAIPTTPLLATNYTAPDNAGIAAIKAKTNNLPSDPADQSELVSLINTLPSASTITNSVWNATLSNYTGPGSTGAKLNLASTLTVGDIPAGLTAAQVWSYATRELTGTQAANLATIPNIPTNPLLATNYTAPDNAGIANTLALTQAFVLGRFKIDYEASTATQYRSDGTVLKVFNLRDKDGNPATNAQTAVDRVPVGEAPEPPDPPPSTGINLQFDLSLPSTTLMIRYL